MTSLRRTLTWPFWTGLALILLAVALGLVVHVGLSTREDTGVLDEFIEHRSAGITAAAVVVTNIFSPVGTIVLSAVIGGLLWWRTRSWRSAAYVLGAVGGSAAITFLLKLLFKRDRPPLTDHLVTEVDFGFPSGHTTGIASLAFSTAALMVVMIVRRRWKAMVWACAALMIAVVAGTRLYLGVHWFTDTLAGAMVGIGSALAWGSVLLGPDAMTAALGRGRSRRE